MEKSKFILNQCETEQTLRWGEFYRDLYSETGTLEFAVIADEIMQGTMDIQKEIDN